MEKTLEIYLQEQRQQIAKDINIFAEKEIYCCKETAQEIANLITGKE